MSNNRIRLKATLANKYPKCFNPNYYPDIVCYFLDNAMNSKYGKYKNKK